MRGINIKENQIILNKINSKVEFTHEFGVDAQKRYVVGSQGIYKGTNPSLDPDILQRVTDALNKPFFLDSIGGWLDKDTGEYCVDANMHYGDIDMALLMANIHQQKAIYDKESGDVLYLTNEKIR